jgi:hypothetical protein
MKQYTGYELNGYDADASSYFETFEYSAPRNARDTVFRKERNYRTVSDDDITSSVKTILLMLIQLISLHLHLKKLLAKQYKWKVENSWGGFARCGNNC